jgi:hypothetical protein
LTEYIRLSFDTLLTHSRKDPISPLLGKILFDWLLACGGPTHNEDAEIRI